MPYETFDDKISLLERYVNENVARKSATTIWEIISVFGFSAQFAFCAILTIPFLQPVPLNGLSIICGTIIALLGLLIFADSKLLIPDWLKRQSLSNTTALKFCSLLRNSSYFLKLLFKPHGDYIHRYKRIRRTSALAIVYCGVLLSLPLSAPGTNSLPALAILVLSLAALEEDVYGILIGYMLTIIATGYIFYTIISSLNRLMAV